VEPATHLLITHEWTYAVTECLHILGFAVAIGSISLVDLHLAGWGFRGVTPAAVLKATAVWTIAGLAVTIAAGLAILSTDAARYLVHPTMRLKLAMLVIAIGYNYTVHRAVARRADRRTPATAVVAAVSVLLWASIVFDGVFYAFT
jgi:hypothetical protein